RWCWRGQCLDSGSIGGLRTTCSQPGSMRSPSRWAGIFCIEASRALVFCDVGNQAVWVPRMGWQWRNKKTTCAGSVLFRGKFSPRAQEFAHLERQGFAVAPADANGAAHWALRIAHPELGEAKVICLRDCPRPPRQLIDFDPMLTRAERERAYLGESTVSVIVQGQREDVLRDRKTLLRFLRAVMGNDGIVAVDHTAQRFWPA